MAGPTTVAGKLQPPYLIQSTEYSPVVSGKSFQDGSCDQKQVTATIGLDKNATPGQVDEEGLQIQDWHNHSIAINTSAYGPWLPLKWAQKNPIRWKCGGISREIVSDGNASPQDGPVVGDVARYCDDEPKIDPDLGLVQLEWHNSTLSSYVTYNCSNMASNFPGVGGNCNASTRDDSQVDDPKGGAPDPDTVPCVRDQEFVFEAPLHDRADCESVNLSLKEGQRFSRWFPYADIKKKDDKALFKCGRHGEEPSDACAGGASNQYVKLDWSDPQKVAIYCSQPKTGRAEENARCGMSFPLVGLIDGDVTSGSSDAGIIAVPCGDASRFTVFFRGPMASQCTVPSFSVTKDDATTPYFSMLLAGPKIWASVGNSPAVAYAWPVAGRAPTNMSYAKIHYDADNKRALILCGQLVVSNVPAARGLVLPATPVQPFAPCPGFPAMSFDYGDVKILASKDLGWLAGATAFFVATVKELVPDGCAYLTTDHDGVIEWFPLEAVRYSSNGSDAIGICKWPDPSWLHNTLAECFPGFLRFDRSHYLKVVVRGSVPTLYLGQYQERPIAGAGGDAPAPSSPSSPSASPSSPSSWQDQAKAWVERNKALAAGAALGALIVLAALLGLLKKALS